MKRRKRLLINGFIRIGYFNFYAFLLYAIRHLQSIFIIQRRKNYIFSLKLGNQSWSGYLSETAVGSNFVLATMILRVPMKVEGMSRA